MGRMFIFGIDAIRQIATHGIELLVEFFEALQRRMNFFAVVAGYFQRHQGTESDFQVHASHITASLPNQVLARTICVIEIEKLLLFKFILLHINDVNKGCRAQLLTSLM
jgi:hypothetical protein